MNDALIKGPGGRLFSLTQFFLDRWEERCPHVDLTTPAHAIRFSRLVVDEFVIDNRKRAVKLALLVYPFDRLIIVGKKISSKPFYFATSVYSIPYCPKHFGISSWAYDDFRLGRPTQSAYRIGASQYLEWYEEISDDSKKAVLKRFRSGYARYTDHSTVW